MDHHNNFVSPYKADEHDTEWRVVAGQLANVTGNRRPIIEAARGDIAPRINADGTTPAERATAFNISAIPVLLVIAMSIAGMVILAFTDKEALGWFLAGTGSLGIIALSYLFKTQENNSPGGVEHGWIRKAMRDSDNDLEARLAAIEADKEVRLAALREYSAIVKGGASGTLPRVDRQAPRLPG